MALKIRLARAGSKKRPYYHLVIADVRSPRDGRFIERVGSWNPMLAKDGEEKRVIVNEERIKHWMSVGALPTDRVARFLDEAGIVKREARNNPNKAKPGKKAEERLAEAAQKAEDAKEAAKAAKAEAKAAKEAAVEEAAAEEAAVEEAPAEKAGAEEAPAEEAPAKEETVAEAPAEEAAAEETAAPEEAPAEEAATTEEAPAEETAAKAS